jgi:hypothetical protein
MTYTNQEIREVYKREIIGKRAGNGGVIPLSMCDRDGVEFSTVKPLSHGFMMRDVIKLRRKNPTKIKAITREVNEHT